MQKKYYEYKVDNLLLVNRIITIHDFSFTKSFASEGEQHNFWEFVFVNSGEVFLKANNNSIKLKANEIYFHKPNEFHQLLANGKASSNVIIVSFSCKSNAMRFFENKKAKIPDNLKNYIYDIVNEGKRKFNIPFSDPNTTKMELSDNYSLGGLQIIKNLLELFLIKLINYETENKVSKDLFIKTDGYKNNVTNRIIQYLKHNIDKKVYISDIANTLCYNQSYIFREFKKTTGITIMQYFITMKLDEAKRLLVEENMSIAQISEKLGFDTPNLFSKTFKKHNKITPLQFKKRNR